LKRNSGKKLQGMRVPELPERKTVFCTKPFCLRQGSPNPAREAILSIMKK